MSKLPRHARAVLPFERREARREVRGLKEKGGERAEGIGEKGKRTIAEDLLAEEVELDWLDAVCALDIHRLAGASHVGGRGHNRTGGSNGGSGTSERDVTCGVMKEEEI